MIYLFFFYLQYQYNRSTIFTQSFSTFGQFICSVFSTFCSILTSVIFRSSSSAVFFNFFFYLVGLAASQHLQSTRERTWWKVDWSWWRCWSWQQSNWRRQQWRRRWTGRGIGVGEVFRRGVTLLRRALQLGVGELLLCNAEFLASWRR